jgi:hypothetical protein
MEQTQSRVETRALRRLVVGLLALVALTIPTAAIAAAEQIVITLVDEPSFWEFDDPCTGEALHGEGTESGVIRITELGDQGHHVRVKVNGVVDLYDEGDEFVGTWSYHTSFGDQFPPDAQGAVHFIASGPLEYADGSTSIIHGHEHTVFEKGDIVKREFFKAVCGGHN